MHTFHWDLRKHVVYIASFNGIFYIQKFRQYIGKLVQYSNLEQCVWLLVCELVGISQWLFMQVSSVSDQCQHDRCTVVCPESIHTTHMHTVLNILIKCSGIYAGSMPFRTQRVTESINQSNKLSKNTNSFKQIHTNFITLSKLKT